MFDSSQERSSRPLTHDEETFCRIVAVAIVAQGDIIRDFLRRSARGSLPQPSVLLIPGNRDDYHLIEYSTYPAISTQVGS